MVIGVPHRIKTRSKTDADTKKGLIGSPFSHKLSVSAIRLPLLPA